MLLRIDGAGCDPAEAETWDERPLELKGAAEVRLRPARACPEQRDVEGRVLDAVTVIAHLRVHAPWWNRRLYLFGAGDGAAVAAATAGLTPETAGVVLVNGQIGGPAGAYGPKGVRPTRSRPSRA